MCLHDNPSLRCPDLVTNIVVRGRQWFSIRLSQHRSIWRVVFSIPTGAKRKGRRFREVVLFNMYPRFYVSTLETFSHLNCVTVDQFISSKTSRYRPINKLKFAEVILLSCSLWPLRTNLDTNEKGWTCWILCDIPVHWLLYLSLNDDLHPGVGAEHQTSHRQHLHVRYPEPRHLQQASILSLSRMVKIG